MLQTLSEDVVSKTQTGMTHQNMKSKISNAILDVSTGTEKAKHHLQLMQDFTTILILTLSLENLQDALDLMILIGRTELESKKNFLRFILIVPLKSMLQRVKSYMKLLRTMLLINRSGLMTLLMFCTRCLPMDMGKLN